MKCRNESETEKLLMDHYDKYYRLAYSYVKSEQDALDIVQESAYKAMKGCRKVKEPEYLSTWLYRIVINTAIDYLKKNKEEPMAEEMMEFQQSGDDAFYDHTEDKWVLKEVLDQLAPPEKTVIILRYFEDKKLEEIADITGENTNTIKARLYRTLKKMRIELENA